MTDYEPPDPSAAEYVHRMNEEIRRCERQIEHLDDQGLKEIVRDRQLPSTLRAVALNQLVPQRDRQDSRADRLGEFLDDPDPHVSAIALFHCPLTAKRLLEKARRLARSNDYRVQGEAVVALAKSRDPELLPQLLEWFAGDDKRHLAIEALVALDTDEAKRLLEQGFEQGGRDDDDRARLAVALLRLQDTRGVDYLETVATRAQGDWSVAAARWLYMEHSREMGLRLMLHILDEGDADVGVVGVREGEVEVDIRDEAADGDVGDGESVIGRATVGDG